MSDLYSNLADILVKVDKNTNIDNVIDQVKQAFMDAGWLNPEQVSKTQDLINYMANTAQDMAKLPVTIEKIGSMTGREWYFRLAKQLRAYSFSVDTQDTILQAAFEVAEGLDKSVDK